MIKNPNMESIDYLIPRHIREMYDMLNKSIPDEYYIVDFLYVDVQNSEPSVVNPTKVIDLENLKDLVLYWFENRHMTKRLSNGIKVKLYPLFEA